MANSLTPKVAILKPNIRPFSREELDAAAEVLADGSVDYRAVEREHVFKREVSDAISFLYDQIDVSAAAIMATFAIDECPLGAATLLTVNFSTGACAVSKKNYAPGTLIFMIQGVKQMVGASFDYVETDPTLGTFTMTADCLAAIPTGGTGTHLTAIYKYK